MRHYIDDHGIPCVTGERDPTLEVTTRQGAVDCPVCIDELMRRGRELLSDGTTLEAPTGGDAVHLAHPSGRPWTAADLA